MIDFLDKMALTPEKLNLEPEYLIPGFLPKRMITMYWADGGNAKTWLSYGTAAYLCEKSLCKALYYFDLDNPLDTLKERKVEDLLMKRYPQVRYIHRSDLDQPALETIERLASKENSRHHAYEDIVFIIDSVRNVAGIKNDDKAMYIMNLFMDIREAGGTLLLLAHSNKDGKNYEGSNNLKNSVDVMFREELLHKIQDVNVTVGLTPTKERSGIRKCDFTIDVRTLAMSEADPVLTRMSKAEEEFVDKVKKALKENPDGLNKTEVLTKAGFKKTDKTAVAMLDKYTGIFWQKEELNSRNFRYFL